MTYSSMMSFMTVCHGLGVIITIIIGICLLLLLLLDVVHDSMSRPGSAVAASEAYNSYSVNSSNNGYSINSSNDS